MNRGSENDERLEERQHFDGGAAVSDGAVGPTGARASRFQSIRHGHPSIGSSHLAIHTPICAVTMAVRPRSGVTGASTVSDHRP